MFKPLIALVFVMIASSWARADATLLLEEPYGKLGFFTGSGHVAIYFDSVCAETPSVLRRCAAGEPGAVIARYNKLKYDWLAIPLLPYLYAVEKTDQIPLLANPKLVAFLRNEYRKRYLRAIASDDPSGEPPSGNWTQLAGSAYDRTIYGFTIQTSEEQDDRLIAFLNSQQSRSRYQSLTENCADFAREVINFYYPKALHRNIIADLGISTPKQMAKALVKFSSRHPQLHSARFVIPQVPGTLPRSTRTHGIAESLLKSKQYVVPLVFVQPILASCVAAAYIGGGRFDPTRDAMVLTPGSRPQPPLEADERRVYENKLNRLLAQIGTEENSSASAKSWMRMQTGAQPKLDAYGRPVLQLRMDEKLVDLGIARGNILTSPASQELAGTAVAARLHWELRRSDSKISEKDLDRDWNLLQQLLPPLRADLN